MTQNQFEALSTHYWQQFCQKQAVGGGMYAQNRLYAANLDESLQSLARLDDLLDDIKPNLAQQSESIWQNNKKFRIFLFFLGFYIVRVLHKNGARLSLRTADAQSSPQQNALYTAVYASDGAQILWPMMTIAARLFGSFLRPFYEPNTKNLSQSSAYWLAKDYLAPSNMAAHNDAKASDAPLNAQPKRANVKMMHHQQSGYGVNACIDHGADGDHIEHGIKQNAKKCVNQINTHQNRTRQNSVNQDNMSAQQAVHNAQATQKPSVNVQDNAYIYDNDAQSLHMAQNRAQYTQKIKNVNDAQNIKDGAQAAQSASHIKPNNATDNLQNNAQGARHAQALKPAEIGARILASSATKIKTNADATVAKHATNTNLQAGAIKTAKRLNTKNAPTPLQKALDNTCADINAIAAKAHAHNTQVMQAHTLLQKNAKHPNAKKALALLQQAAKQNNAFAHLALALFCLQNGIGDKKGATFLQKSAELGDARAQRLLSRLHYQGEVVQNSTNLGEYWLKKAADSGHTEAKTLVATFKHIQEMKQSITQESKKDTRYMLLVVAICAAGLFLLYIVGKMV